jgi:flagellar motor protein MotB
MSKLFHLPMTLGILMLVVSASAGQVNTTQPGESAERHLSGEQTFQEWSLPSVPADDIKRVRICRVETVCMMRFREGNTPRTRVRNLIAPLLYADETTPVPDSFITQIRQALDNLRDKQGVTIRFIGYTDSAPLTERDQDIYGDLTALSKANAYRVAVATGGALGLPAEAIESDGRGASQPVASNDTQQGRAMNRRVEVEFWYDDPLQELPDEPQFCPGANLQEIVTRVYEAPWGVIPTLELDENGQPIVPAGFAATLRRALDDIADRNNPRVRFIGYTKNEVLDRRAASVYGDDVGLSASRALRAMNTVMQDPILEGAGAEHEGRGYVQSDDVVNTGFIQGDESYVRVQVVYDEPLPLDDY